MTAIKATATNIKARKSRPRHKKCHLLMPIYKTLCANGKKVSKGDGFIYAKGHLERLPKIILSALALPLVGHQTSRLMDI